jgi:hypothetical protein
MNVTTQSFAVAANLTTTNPTADVTLTVPGDVTVGGAVSTRNLTQNNGAGTTTFNGPVTLTGSATLNVTGDVTFNKSLAAVNLTQGGATGSGTTTFNGPVTLGGQADLTTGTVVANSTFDASKGNATFRAGVAVDVNDVLSAKTLFVGGGASNARPVTSFDGGVALSESAVLVAKSAAFNNRFGAEAGTVSLDATAGATEGPGGAIVTRSVSLTGAGTFQLDTPGNDATDANGGLFADLTGGAVLFRDANSLNIRFRVLTDNSRPAIRIGGDKAVLELTSGEGFDATDTTAGPDGAIAKDRPLIDVGPTGEVRIFPGANFSDTVRPDVTVPVTYVAETIAAAGSVKIGVPLIVSVASFPAAEQALRQSENDYAVKYAARANKAVETFVVRPSQNTTTFVYGNEPVRDPDRPLTGDSLSPVFAGVTPSTLARAGDDGTFSFQPDARTFRDLVFRSIEGLGGINLNVFVVQTAPRAGDELSKDYAIRILGSAQTPQGQPGVVVGGGNVSVPISGDRIPPNPFVVSPEQTSPVVPFTGPRVAVADVNGDNVPDLIIANGAGDLPIVTVVDGAKFFSQAAGAQALDFSKLAEQNALITQFFAYEAGFTGGMTVAARDLNGDKRAEIITGPGPGGGQRVRLFTVLPPDAVNKLTVFTNTVQFDGIPGKGDFFAFTGDPDFRGGVNVALGDVDGDTKADVVVGAGVGGGPRVQVYGGADGSVIRNFFAYDAAFRGGVYVDAGFYDADELADIVTAPGPGGGPHIRVFLGSQAQGTVYPQPTDPVTNFVAFGPDPSLVAGEQANRGGVSGVAFGSSSGGSGRNQAILVSTPRGREIQVLRFDPLQLNPDGSLKTVYDLDNDGVNDFDLLDSPFLVPITDQNGNPIDTAGLRDGGAVTGFSQET